MARPVSSDAVSANCATPHVVDDSVAAVGSEVPGSLNVLVAPAAVALNVPVGSGSPGQLALFALIGADVVDDVHTTLTGVVPSRSMVPLENEPMESASCPWNPAQARPLAVVVTLATTAKPARAMILRRAAGSRPAVRCRGTSMSSFRTTRATFWRAEARAGHLVVEADQHGPHDRYWVIDQVSGIVAVNPWSALVAPESSCTVIT